MWLDAVIYMAEKVEGAKLPKFRKIFSALPSAPQKCPSRRFAPKLWGGANPHFAPMGRLGGHGPPHIRPWLGARVYEHVQAKSKHFINTLHRIYILRLEVNIICIFTVQKKGVSWTTVQNIFHGLNA